jgi:hypothetical protein
VQCNWNRVIANDLPPPESQLHTHYNEMIFQLKAFVALTEILFGDDSITTDKLKMFVQLIEAQSIYYKGVVVYDEFFPTKVLWTVCTRFQLYLESCTQSTTPL